MPLFICVSCILALCVISFSWRKLSIIVCIHYCCMHLILTWFMNSRCMQIVLITFLYCRYLRYSSKFVFILAACILRALYRDSCCMDSFAKSSLSYSASTLIIQNNVMAWHFFTSSSCTAWRCLLLLGSLICLEGPSGNHCTYNHDWRKYFWREWVYDAMMNSVSKLRCMQR